ncbi:MAG: Gfo/Idh/MocA family protein [Paracoccaceae bacterium]
MTYQIEQAGIVGVSIVGAGERGIYYIGTRMAELAAETGFRIVGIYDVLPERAHFAAEHLNTIYLRLGIAHSVKTFDCLADATGNPEVALVIVTTHTNAHREPTEAALKAGKFVYLDKPISVTIDDAHAILAAEKSASKPVMMGFTRRFEKPWIEAIRLAHSGEIGAPQMILLRSVIPYTRYLQLWHRNSALSGGAINDKCSHHFDVLNWITNSPVVSVTAIGGRSDIFAPDPDAPERCGECDRDCPYRRHQTLVDEFEGVGQVANASWTDATRIEDRNDTCVYLPGADIDDHAIITVTFENGMIACIFFSIFGPWTDDQETLEIVGASGRLRMTRHTGDIDVVSQHGHKTETISFKDSDRESTHFGADLELVRSMRRFVEGEKPVVGPHQGLASLKMVLATIRSLNNGGLPVDPEKARLP